MSYNAIQKFFSDNAIIRKLFLVSSAWVMGLVLGAAYLSLYYPSLFHSDSASIQILAQAIADEINLLPHDFNYGNQLILFRANFFIAAALKLGMTGYSAYMVGSSISISLFFVIAFITLDTIFHHWGKSLLLTVLLFLPIGIEEADYIIGQQSHLANIVLSLVIVIQTYRWCWFKERYALVTASLFFFLIALEEPIRALLVFIPLSTVIIVSRKSKQSKKLILAFTVAIFTGYVCNRYLVATHSVYGLQNLALPTGDQFLERASILLKGFVGNYIGLGQFGGVPLTFINIMQFSAKVLVLGLFLLLFYVLTYSLVELVTKSWLENRNSRHKDLLVLEFVGLVGMAGVLFGFCVTSAVSLDPGIRNFLWALELCKFLLLAYFLIFLKRTIPNELLSYVAILSIVLMASSVSASLLYAPRTMLSQTVEKKIDSPLDRKIQELTLLYNVDKIYGGNFWKILRLEVLAPPTKGSVLGLWNDKFYFSNWLTRPSRRCVSSPVLYLLDKSKVDLAIARKLIENDGKILYIDGDDTIYLALPIWDMQGCENDLGSSG